MHQQIKGSPGDTASNIRSVVNALTERGINILGIAPDFDPPHVRVAVEHAERYDPSNPDDPFNQALAAMEDAGMAPQVKSSVLVKMPDKPGALAAALSRLTREGYVVESILVLTVRSDDNPKLAHVSFGVSKSTIPDWDAESDKLEQQLEEELNSLPDA